MATGSFVRRCRTMIPANSLLQVGILVRKARTVLYQVSHHMNAIWRCDDETSLSHTMLLFRLLFAFGILRIFLTLAASLVHLRSVRPFAFLPLPSQMLDPQHSSSTCKPSGQTAWVGTSVSTPPSWKAETQLHWRPSLNLTSD